MDIDFRLFCFALLALLIIAASGTPATILQETTSRKQAVIDSEAAQYLDKTNGSHNPRHGTQVEYTSADGKAFLWYPGNSVVLEGEWRVQISEDYLEAKRDDGSGRVSRRGYLRPNLNYGSTTETCFRYGVNTYNPVTKTQGGKWECQLSVLINSGASASKFTFDGDPFDLANRKEPPFKLTKDRSDFDRVKALGG